MYHNQTWGQFHFVNSNSTRFPLVNSNCTSNWSIPISIPNVLIPILIPFLPTLFYLLPFTVSRYFEYLLWVPSWDTYSELFIFQVGLSWEKYFWIKKLNGKLICGFNYFVENFNCKFKFINSNFSNKQFQFRNSLNPMSIFYIMFMS